MTRTRAANRCQQGSGPATARRRQTTSTRPRTPTHQQDSQVTPTPNAQNTRVFTHAALRPAPDNAPPFPSNIAVLSPSYRLVQVMLRCWPPIPMRHPPPPPSAKPRAHDACPVNQQQLDTLNMQGIRATAPGAVISLQHPPAVAVARGWHWPPARACTAQYSKALTQNRTSSCCHPMHGARRLGRCRGGHKAGPPSSRQPHP